MPAIEIVGTGWIDRRDSAFPQAVQLATGDILCSFGVGGGAFVHGGTDWARSTDGGETWSLEGTILAPTTDPRTTAALKLSLAADGQTVFAYGARSYPAAGQGFGHIRNEPVLCRSTDGGRTWSRPLGRPDAGRLSPGDFSRRAAARIGPAPRASGHAARPRPARRASAGGDLRRWWAYLAAPRRHVRGPATALRLFRAEAGRASTRPPDRDGLDRDSGRCRGSTG